MNKYFKNAVIFATGAVSGFGLCGGLIFKKVLASDDLRAFITKKISKRILNSIYGDPEYRKNKGYYFEDIVFDNRTEANKAIDDMRDILERYGVVTVSDLHDLCDITSVYTDNKYGWTNLREAEVVRIRGGYKLSLPMALPLL